MENIVSFPTKSIRDWLIIERAMKEQLLHAGASSGMQIRLIEKMKAFYEILDAKFDFSIEITFPNAIPKNVSAAICSDVGDKIGMLSSQQLQAFTNKLFTDRLQREIEICGELGLL